MKKKQIFNYILILLLILILIILCIYIYTNINLLFAFDKIQKNLLLTNLSKRNVNINIYNQNEWFNYYNLLQYLIEEYKIGNISKKEYLLIKNFYLKYNIKVQNIKDICNYKKIYNDIFFYKEFLKCFEEKHYKNNFILNWKDWELCRLIFQKLYLINYDEYILIYEDWFIKKKRYKQYTNYIDFLLYMHIITVYGDYDSVNVLNPVMVNCIILDVYKFSKWNLDPSFIAEIYLKFQNKILLKSLYKENLSNIINKDYHNKDLKVWNNSIKFFIEEKLNNRLKILEKKNFENKFIDLNNSLNKNYFIYPTDIIELYVLYFKDLIDENMFIEILYYHIIYYNSDKESFLEICYLISKLNKDSFNQKWTSEDYIDFYFFVKNFQYNFNIKYWKFLTIEENYIIYKQLFKYYIKYNNSNKILYNLKINFQNFNINKLNLQINIKIYNNKEIINIKKILILKK